MAKIFRFSGYFVDADKRPYEDCYCFSADLKYEVLDCTNEGAGVFQQLHCEESENFEVDGELDKNCDLALLTRHFKKHTDAEFDRPLPQPGEKYKHFKIGKIITVIGISRHTETEEISVVYDYEGTIWNRPLDMFMSEVNRVKYPDAVQKYRFEKVEE